MSNNRWVYKIVGSLLVGSTIVLAQPCLSRDYGNGGTVCVCNENYCDTVPPVKRVPTNQYLVYTSNKAGERFTRTINHLQNATTRAYKERSDIICQDQIYKEFEICGEKHINTMRIHKKGNYNHYQKLSNRQVYIDPSITYQEIIGFGGAFTDTTGINIKGMSPKLQDHLMRSYFAEDGIEYNLCRVPMGGTDFSTRYYSYVDTDEYEVNCVDPLLRNFRLAQEDFLYKIPLIEEAMRLTNNNMQLFTSNWIAPKAMKDNNNYRGLMGFLKEGLYQLWADYFVKFLDLYLDHGIQFWGITTGNEPFLAMLQYFTGVPGVLWLPDDLGRWIRDYLGPTIRRSAHKHINILTLDDQRPLLLHVLPKIFADQSTLNYVQGIALHWYLDFDNNTYLLDKTHELYPNKFLLSTEACEGSFEKEVLLGAWSRGENYAKDIIEDLNHWVTGWVDWNMVLDTEGGPTVASPTDSPIIANGTEFYKQPMYYALGHFSKFIPRGSVRIYSSQCDGDNLVDLVAFKRPDGGIVVVILNRSGYSVQRTLVNVNRGEIDLKLSPRSITTVLYWQNK